MKMIDAVSYFDLALVVVLFLEYILFRLGHAKYMFDNYRIDKILHEENREKQDAVLESVLYQLDDFSLRIQKIDENMRKYIDDEIYSCNQRINSQAENKAFSQSSTEWKELQHKVRELTTDMSSIWRIVEIPQHMMHLRPHFR
jgi:hypothetical protein